MAARAVFNINLLADQHDKPLTGLWGGLPSIADSEYVIHMSVQGIFIEIPTPLLTAGSTCFQRWIRHNGIQHFGTVRHLSGHGGCAPDPCSAPSGGRASFGGVITTVKCFRSNGLIRELVQENGAGRVLLIDGGGSMRRALIDSEIATTAAENGWEGIVCYGCVREVDILEDLDIGIPGPGCHSGELPTAGYRERPTCRSTSAALPSCRMITFTPIPQGHPLPDALDIRVSGH